jgi:hypothetical protein
MVDARFRHTRGAFVSELTHGRSGGWLLIASALGLLISLAVIAPQANAEHGEPELVGGNAGIIVLSTGPDTSVGGDNWIRYYDEAVLDALADGESLNVDDSWTKDQPLTATRCGVETDNTILEISQTGGAQGVGLVSNGLGARDKRNCSTDGGQVGPDESLTFQVSLEIGGNTDFWISEAEIDVEGKHNAKLGVSLDGVAVDDVPLKDSNDNGPDSGIGDNDIAPIDGYFQRITLTATNSSKATVSIEGGGDGDLEDSPLRDSYGVNQSVFRVWQGEIYDHGDLDCVGEDSTSGPTAPVDEEGPALVIHLTRGDNRIYEGKPNQECVPVAYTFRIEDDSVFFDADLTGQENARFLIRIEWDPASPEVDPFNSPDRSVNFFPEGRTDGYDQVEPCTGLESEGPAPTDVDPDKNDIYGHPTGAAGGTYGADEIVPWCLAGEQLVLLGDGTWQQIQWYDGAGDPHWR